MKKSKKLFLSLTTLTMGLALIACTTDATSSLTSSSQPQSSSTPEPEIVEVEVEKKFGVNVAAAEGTTVNIVDPQENGYSAGSELKFTVTVNKSHLELESVKYDGKAVLPDAEGVYTVVVLNKEATIETTVVVRGEENLLEVSNVDQTTMPTTAEELKLALENTVAAESKYMSTGTYYSTYESYEEEVSLKAEIGHNDVAIVEGHSISYASSNIKNYSYTETSLHGDKLHTVIDSAGASRVDSLQATIQSVVSDETEPNSTQIKASDAAKAVSTSGFVEKLMKRSFGNSDESFVSTSSYGGWKEITVSSTLAEDGKSYFASASAFYSYYDRFVNLTVEIDGDGFLRNADLQVCDYATSDVEEVREMVTPEEGGDPVDTLVGHKPADGATPEEVQVIQIEQVRGYRSSLNSTDLSNYVTSDYDVLIDYEVQGSTRATVGEDNVVYNSAKLNFRFRQREFKPVFIVPTLVGSKEEGFITFDNYGNATVAKEGEFHLVFDNGLGDIKEVKLNSLRPLPSSISAYLSSNSIYNGESATLTAAIVPAGAEQEVTVTLDSSSTANVEITKNEDGTYDIKGTQNGTGTLVVTSVADESLSTTVNFTVAEKPTLESVTAFLTTYTLEGDSGYYGYHYVNFNADGTGAWNVDDYGLGSAISFTWSINESTFEVTINDTPLGSCKGYYLEGVTNVSNTGATLQYNYYNGSTREVALKQGTTKYSDLNNI